MKKLAGFCYATGEGVERDAREWRRRLTALIAAGGSRRVEDGETFGKCADGTIAFEVYGRVNEEKQQ